MRFVRTFLLILIIIGTGLLLTQNFWVPPFVSWILKNETGGTKVSDQVVIDHPKLETVKFCDRTYQTKPIILFGVDMMLRIAELATAEPNHSVCTNITLNIKGSTIIPDLRYLPEDSSGVYYYLSLGPVMFSFVPKTEEIFIHSGFDGSPTLFGYFK